MAKKVIPYKKKKSRIGLKIFLTIILLVGGFYALISLSKIERINVLGESRYEDEEILKMLEIEEGMSFLDAYMKKMNKTTLLPFLESAEFRFNSLNNISILVKSKEITSLIPFQERYIALDKNGYVLGYEKNRKDGVPVSLGINLKEAVIGEVVGLDEELINSILVIYFSAKKYDLDVKEIMFLGARVDDIHLYMSGVDVFLGDVDDIDRKIKTVKEVMKKLPEDSKGVLDLSMASKNYVFVPNKDYEEDVNAEPEEEKTEGEIEENISSLNE